MDHDDTSMKKRFAYLYLQKFRDGFSAAMALFGSVNVAYCLEVGRVWPFDVVVVDEIQRLLEEHGEDHFLPSRFQTAADLWQHAQEMKRGGNYRAYSDAMKQYRETLGFISAGIKRDPADSANGGGVMRLPAEPTSNDSWEQRAQQQQRELADPGTVH